MTSARRVNQTTPLGLLAHDDRWLTRTARSSSNQFGSTEIQRVAYRKEERMNSIDSKPTTTPITGRKLRNGLKFIRSVLLQTIEANLD